MRSSGISERWPVVKLGDVADLCLGKMLDANKNKGRLLPYLRNPNVRWFDVDTTDLRMMRFEEHEDDRYGLLAGDVLICEGGEAGRAAIWDGRIPALKFQKAIHRVRPAKDLDARYLVHRLMADYHSGRLADYYTGATIKHLTGQDLARYRFPLPPLPEQRRIAEILDKAEALRAKRRAALGQLDSLTQSIFLDMFGDPATSTKAWPMRPLGSVALKFSDGPFGSNLKTEHYCDNGVRVVRLQNVGVGRFLDENCAFISPEHFERLRKHECVPGDIIIATLGDPNLRACVIPSSIRLALNKADCIQMRADESQTNSDYLCALLNHPSTLKLAQDLMHGQTRVRISMGQLRLLRIPMPPMELQSEFARRVTAVNALRDAHDDSYSHSNALSESLQYRAFRGEL